MVKAVESAIIMAETGKSAGHDELFVELFKLHPKLIARTLCEIWHKYGTLRYSLTERQKEILVPSYKKGPKDDPQSYRSITLLSHARKVVEAGLAMCINKCTTFYNTQIGFTKDMNTTTGIIRTTQHFQQKRGHVAILDLKNAYNQVPRDKLTSIIYKRVNTNMANMIMLCLQPLELETQKDHNKTKAYQKRGVPQGSPLSPCLYNLYMDTYPEYVRQHIPDENKTWSLDLYAADDIKIQAINRLLLQNIINRSSTWAKIMR